jgi:hypothetical protein
VRLLYGSVGADDHIGAKSTTGGINPVEKRSRDLQGCDLAREAFQRSR